MGLTILSFSDPDVTTLGLTPEFRVVEMHSMILPLARHATASENTASDGCELLSSDVIILYHLLYLLINSRCSDKIWVVVLVFCFSYP